MAVFPKAFYKRIRRSSGSVTSSLGKKNIFDVLSAVETGVRMAKSQAENDALKDLYLEYWAYQYAMLYCLAYPLHTDPDYPSIIRRFQESKWLLKYDHVKKVHVVRLLVSALGVNGAIRVLTYYYQHWGT